MGKRAAEAAALNFEYWMDWYRDGENIQQAALTTTESEPSCMWNIVFYNDNSHQWILSCIS
jgi:hypothetical protein